MMGQDNKITVDMMEKTNVEGVDVPGSTDITFRQALKANPKVMINCILMTLGPMAFGFDIIIVGVVTAIPAFLQTYGEFDGKQYILPSLWLSLWNAFMQIGFMIGSVLNGWLSDRFGRKVSMMAGAAITSLGVAVIFTSDLSGSVEHRRGAFLAGKIVLGIGLSMMATTSLIYNSEIIHPKLRGVVLSLFQFFLVFGQMIAAFVAGSQITIGFQLVSYRTCFATQWAMAGAALVAALVVPESPVYLLKRGKVEAARKSLTRLHDPTMAESSLISIQETLDHEKAEQQLSSDATYLECFKGHNWRRTRIILYASIVQQFHGISFVANGTYFMIVAGLSPVNAIKVLEVACALALVGIMVSWFLSHLAGRRPTLIGCTAFLCPVWISIGIAGCYPTSKAALWYMGIMINLILFFFNVGAGPVIPIIVAETSSVRLRAKANGIGFLCNGFASWAFNFFVPYLFNVDELNWGGKTGFFFAGLTAIAGVVLWLELPEMKNRTYRQLDEMFENRVRTRDFRKYACTT
ncbi:hypothetical protein LTR84_010549 [Exophiala bonariae]|uniref:Major facilitator superfamily (MFS) profile domain-containing protein n=1 Tax=Exophiala bonariae TaxID=1690606 RepID=A0AAV9MVM5_9EURO|nr:hypothetical protein LTR84_010549 [Exophiala bonariae]